MTEDATRFFYSPVRIVTGAGCVRVIAEELARLGVTRTLLVSDAGVRGAGIVDKVAALLRSATIPYTVFDAIKPNPTVENVKAGVEALGGDIAGAGIVAAGGGSVMDAAKMIGALATNGGKVQDYDGVDMIPRRMLPMIAVNTTAGTASEVTRWAVITDVDRAVKMAIGDENIVPDVAIDDPELTLALPAGATAQTGMDALTHAIEGYVGLNHTPLTDAMAAEAIALIADHLQTAVADGANLTARTGMMYAQTAAGLAFQNAGVGNAHAMAHQLGAVHDMGHGLANAVLLPYVMEYNAPVCLDKMARIARLLGSDVEGLSAEEAASHAAAAVARLNKAIGIPASLRECDLIGIDLDLLAEKALADGATTTNPRQTSLQEMRALWTAAYEGTLRARALV